MIDCGHALPLAAQARQLGISRGSIYYLPRPISNEDLAVMRRIDRIPHLAAARQKRYTSTSRFSQRHDQPTAIHLSKPRACVDKPSHLSLH